MGEYSIYSPMPTGNGAWILHNMLSHAISNYHLHSLTPYQAIFPQFVNKEKNKLSNPQLYHSAPDLGSALIPKEGRVVNTFHNFYYDDFMLKYSSFSQKVFYLTVLKHYINQACQDSDYLVCPSNFIADLVIKYLPKYKQKIVIIKNGINLNLFKPKPPVQYNNKVKILFSGNPTRRKGLKALFAIAEQLDNGCVLQCTSGTRGISLSTHSNIEWLGNVPYEQMPEIYQQADILLFPTIREGFGLCVAEAMACGLPVVSTNCSSIPELIEHKKGGFLSDINDINDMLKKLNILINDPILRFDMGRYNVEKATTAFNSKRMVSEYQSLFESLI